MASTGAWSAFRTDATPVPLPKFRVGARKVDVAKLYNVERYRPNYTSKLGAPLFQSILNQESSANEQGARGV